MLHFYTHKESIPSEITFIDDIEAFFYMSLVGTNASKYDSDICNIVLSTIDKVTYRDGSSLKSELGDFTLKDISTGAKGALLALTNPNYCVSNMEMGDNVIRLLVSQSDATDTHIFAYNSIEVQTDNIIVTVNNRKMTLLDATCDIMDELDKQ